MSSGVETPLISLQGFDSLTSPLAQPPLFPSMSRLPQPLHSRVRCASLEMTKAIILVEIRLSVLSRPRNHQAMALQSFSIPQCEDDEIQASMHATFVAENPLRASAHRLYRRALGDRDDEDARESDESVRCSRHSIKLARLLDRTARYSVFAPRPRRGVALIRLRSTGCRPIFPSITPAALGNFPATSAR